VFFFFFFFKENLTINLKVFLMRLVSFAVCRKTWQVIKFYEVKKKISLQSFVRLSWNDNKTSCSSHSSWLLWKTVGLLLFHFFSSLWAKIYMCLLFWSDTKNFSQPQYILILATVVLDVIGKTLPNKVPTRL